MSKQKLIDLGISESFLNKIPSERLEILTTDKACNLVKLIISDRFLGIRDNTASPYDGAFELLDKLLQEKPAVFEDFCDRPEQFQGTRTPFIALIDTVEPVYDPANPGTKLFTFEQLLNPASSAHSTLTDSVIIGATHEESGNEDQGAGV